MDTTSTPIRPSDQQCYDWAVALVNAMLDSASTDVVKPVEWWDRARTALETGAAVSATFGQCVAKIGKKLQVHTLSKDSAAAVARLAADLGDPRTFAAFRSVAIRDVVYVVGMARIWRDERKATARAAKEALTQPAPIGE